MGSVIWMHGLNSVDLVKISFIVHCIVVNIVMAAPRPGYGLASHTLPASAKDIPSPVSTCLALKYLQLCTD